jgi:hypothetical protein
MTPEAILVAAVPEVAELMGRALAAMFAGDRRAAARLAREAADVQQTRLLADAALAAQHALGK